MTSEIRQEAKVALRTIGYPGRMGRLEIASVALASGLLLGACAQAQDDGRAAGREPVVGLPCEGCEAVFDGLPEELGWSVRLAPEDEPGEPMRIEGRVLDPEGRPAEGIVVYAYHTDARGIYPRDERLRGQAAYRHGRLRGWAQSDAAGSYRFDTIRPASYPDNRTPAHVHMHVIEPGCCTYYIDDIEFLDDPRLPPEERRREADARGGSGLVTPAKDEDGVWVVTRDIVLGENVPGRPAAGAAEPVSSEAEAGFTALAIDLRGYGRSGPREGSPCRAARAEDVAYPGRT